MECYACGKEATKSLILPSKTYSLCDECWDIHHRGNEQAVPYALGQDVG